jgi:hypothetical protein
VVSICHCKDCQKQTGSAFVEVVAVPDSEITVTGATNAFTANGDSGRSLTRRFCSKCGSTVVMNVEAMPGMTLIMGGTLDDSSWLRPRMALFCDSAQPWVLGSLEMTRHARMPT